MHLCKLPYDIILGKRVNFKENIEMNKLMNVYMYECEWYYSIEFVMLKKKNRKKNEKNVHLNTQKNLEKRLHTHTHTQM